ncbi:hypothetical protein ACLOJK_015819 [Asimina triloba]
MSVAALAISHPFQGRLPMEKRALFPSPRFPSILSPTHFRSFSFFFSFFLSHAPKPSSPPPSSISCPFKMPRFPNLPFSLSLLFFLSFTISSSAKESPFSDRRALLRFKSSITEDHLGLLSDWNPRDRSSCSWNGVACDPRSGRVVALVLLAANRSCLPAIPTASGNSSSHPSPDFSACYGVLGRERNDTTLLRGRLSPAVGELTELRVLALGFCGFFGEIPQEVGKLRSLQVLDLGFNEFEGGVPPSLAGCVQLQAVNLAGNQLNGTVPVVFSGFQNLTFLSLSYNAFEGWIPEEFGESCGTLEHLHLAGNELSGSIPSNLGNCSKLRSLVLSANHLENGIPSDLGKLQSLEALDLSRNFLSGDIPSELGNCKQLEVLVLKSNFDVLLLEDGMDKNTYVDDFNYFEGEMPESVVKLPKLRILWAPNANLEGNFPQDWGSCGSLEIVNLAQNYLDGVIPSSLGQCKNLHYLDVSSNQLSGGLMVEFPVPCMDVFNASRNFFSGNIPNFAKNGCSVINMNSLGDIWGLTNFYSSLIYSTARASISMFLLPIPPDGLAILHDFSENRFTGPLPVLLFASNLSAVQAVYAFVLSNNNLEGNLSAYPFDACANLDSLIIDISGNQISGELPSDMGKHCESLRYLDVAGNTFVGVLPSSFAYLNSLVYLDVSRNKLQGQIPSYFRHMKDMKHISLSYNNFTGKIPPDLAQLASLEFLDLSSNSFSGEIPAGLAKLQHLSVLLLDNNNLSGQIPGGLSSVTSLSVFNASFNNLSGSLPANSSWMKCESVRGNPNLQPCRAPPSPPSSFDPNSSVPQTDAIPPSGSMTQNSNRLTPLEIAAVISSSIIVSVLVALLFILVCVRKCVSKTDRQKVGKKEVITFNNIGVQLTYENVVKGTGCFNMQNLIGNGGFGATYKAEIVPGVAVAVKRLSIGRFQGVQQFSAEIRTLGRVQHPNLVTLIGYHASEAEMFLIYNYLPGGNLERFILDRSKRAVDWSMLHKIALDIARALAYLHDECVPRVLHRDIKPSNILLDNNCNAYLSDFGLARILGNSETHATTDVAGTFGYVAPEYAMTCRVSDKADVYSYGIVLLELLSDKKALDPSFSSFGNGFNIAGWANMLLKEGRAREFFTEGLWDVGPQHDLIETLHLGVMCTVDSLSTRPSMKQVAQRLKRIQPPTC